MAEKKHLLITPLEGVEGSAGGWLWAFQDTRKRTLDALAGLDDETVNWPAPQGTNSIGTLLYHIAAIEISWLFEDILEGEEFPPEITELMIYEVRDAAGQLVSVNVEPLAVHLDRLQRCREYFISRLTGMTAADFRRPRKQDKYDATPEWILHHLIQHEVEHRGQIGEIRLMAERALGKTPTNK